MCKNTIFTKKAFILGCCILVLTSIIATSSAIAAVYRYEGGRSALLGKLKNMRVREEFYERGFWTRETYYPGTDRRKSLTKEYYDESGYIYRVVRYQYDGSEPATSTYFADIYYDKDGTEVGGRTYEYDAATGRQLSRIDIWEDKNGNRFKRKYDTSPIKDGLNVPRQDWVFRDGEWVLSYKQEYNYDNSTYRVTDSSYTHYHADGETVRQQTQYTYDPDTGRKTFYSASYKDEDGNETRRTEYTYDPERNIQTSRTDIWIQYGRKHKRTYNTKPATDGEVKEGMGNENILISSPRVDSVWSDTLNKWVATYKEEYEYDNSEGVKRITNRIYTRYHADGVTERVKAENKYDPDTGRKVLHGVSYKDADGNETLRAEYRYDPEKDILTSQTSIWTDKNGRKLKRTYKKDPAKAGKNTPREDSVWSDALNKWVTTYKQTYEYDNSEGVKRITNRTYTHYHADGVTESAKTQYAYDEYGRMTTSTSTSYDANGNETGRNSRTHDLAPLPSQGTNVATDTGAYKHSYEYDADAKRATSSTQEWFNADGTKRHGRNYTYDADTGAKTKYVHADYKNGTKYREYTYKYDTESGKQTEQATITYNADGSEKAKSVNKQKLPEPGPNTAQENFRYDATKPEGEKWVTTYKHSYEYDADAKRATSRTQEWFNADGTKRHDRNYTYDADTGAKTKHVHANYKNGTKTQEYTSKYDAESGKQTEQTTITYNTDGSEKAKSVNNTGLPKAGPDNTLRESFIYDATKPEGEKWVTTYKHSYNYDADKKRGTSATQEWFNADGTKRQDRNYTYNADTGAKTKYVQVDYKNGTKSREYTFKYDAESGKQTNVTTITHDADGSKKAKVVHDQRLPKNGDPLAGAGNENIRVTTSRENSTYNKNKGKFVTTYKSSYKYDVAAKRTTDTTNEWFNANGTKRYEQKYTYNATTGRKETYRTTTGYTYDANKNVTGYTYTEISYDHDGNETGTVKGSWPS